MEEALGFQCLGRPVIDTCGQGSLEGQYIGDQALHNNIDRFKYRVTVGCVAEDVVSLRESKCGADFIFDVRIPTDEVSGLLGVGPDRRCHFTRSHGLAHGRRDRPRDVPDAQTKAVSGE